MSYGVALVYLLFRVVFALLIGLCHAVAVLFFSPLVPKNKKAKSPRAPFRGKAPLRRAVLNRETKRGVVVYAEPSRAVALPTRNETDCTRALVELGFNKVRAAEITKKVVAELGGDAPLNAMVKRGLQLLGPVL